MIYQYLCTYIVQVNNESVYIIKHLRYKKITTATALDRIHLHIVSAKCTWYDQMLDQQFAVHDNTWKYTTLCMMYIAYILYTTMIKAK